LAKLQGVDDRQEDMPFVVVVLAAAVADLVAAVAAAAVCLNRNFFTRHS
jgi:hypothetical protein